MDDKKTGIKQNLTNYGDLGFSTFLRKSFIKGLGYSDAMLDKPIVGIINTFSNYNSWIWYGCCKSSKCAKRNV